MNMQTRVLHIGLMLYVLALLVAPQTSARAADSRVRVVSPQDGQEFAPGDTVAVTVAFEAPFGAGFVSPSAGGGIIELTPASDGSFHAQFKIPEDFEGPLTITPAAIDASGNTTEGVGVTIFVRSRTPPLRLRLVTDEFFLSPGETAATIDVRGVYANNVERDLTSSQTGTTYRSSDTRVIAVDPNGIARVRAFGTAVVIVKNSGRKAFASFWVDDPRHPSAPVDVTSRVIVTRETPQITADDPYENTYAQTLRITNPMPLPLPGRIYVVISNLPARAVIYAGRTKQVEPIGSPYYSLQLPNGLILQPGQSVTMTLKMYVLAREPVDYDVRVFQSLAEP